MGSTTKVESTELYVVDSNTTTLSLGAGDTSLSASIYSYRPATDYSVAVTLSRSSPRYSYKPGYHVFDLTTGATLWGIRALFDPTGPFGTDANGNQIYALLQIFVERSNTAYPSSTPTFTIDYWFLNQSITTS